MDSNFYQTKAAETNLNKGDLYLLLGLISELGEVVNALGIRNIDGPHGGEVEALLDVVEAIAPIAARYKRDIRDSGDEYAYTVAPSNLNSELGDMLWYLSQIAMLHHYSLDTVMAKNLEKLRGRAARGTIKGRGDER